MTNSPTQTPAPANAIIQLSPAAAVSMADAWYDHSSADHFWVRHRNAVLDRHFGRVVQTAAAIGEVGCGNGLILSHLEQRYGKAADGFELNRHALELCQPLASRLFVYDIFERQLSLRDRYDLMLLMDVLEHIEDEVAFLQAVGDHLQPNGRLLIGVPMRSHLYSMYDEVAGHHRRYESDRLRSVATQAGFQVERLVQWGHCYIPILWLRQQMLKKASREAVIEQGFAASPIVNQVLGQLRHCDYLPTGNWTGTAAMLLVRKPDG
jgi:SAM-dependent methyltransferase